MRNSYNASRARVRRRRVSRWSAAGIAAALSGALILTGLPAVADEAPTPEPTTPITVQNTVPDAGTPDAAVPDETPGADVAPEDEAVAPEDADGDVADGVAADDNSVDRASDGAEPHALEAAISPLAVTTFVCEAERVYTLSRPTSGSTSEVRLVNTATGVSTAGVSFSQRNTNGLAMSGDATTAYAVLQGERNSGDLPSSQTDIYAVTADGNTSTVSQALSLVSGSYSISRSALVAGAINPVNGYYYFAGYGAPSGSSRAQLYLYAYDLVNNSYKGMVGRVGISGSDSSFRANGDMAFDAQGNLYIIWSGASGNNVANQLVRVDAGNVPAVGGTGTIASTSLTAPASATDGQVYNGATFDANGSFVIQKTNANITGGTTRIVTSDPNTGTYTNTVSITPVFFGTDLASCAYPPTLQLKKNVVGRVADGDQFQLQVRQSGSSTDLANETTSGSATGVQAVVAGPVIAVPGRQYTIREVQAGSSVLMDYATAYACYWGSETSPFAIGTVTGSSPREATLPAVPSNRSGQALTCTFTNTPLISPVTITKYVQDSRGENQQVASGWTVGAAVSATTGSATPTPSAPTAQTNASGQASWSLRFGSLNDRASITVSETQKTGHQFVSGQCVVTPLTGSPRTVSLSNEVGAAITGVAPGDKVACTYVNKVRPATVTIGKQLQDFTGANAQPAGGWTVGATLVSPASGVTITTPATAQTQPGTGQVSTPWTVDYPVPAAGQSLASATVNVQETMQTGYAFVSGTCTITSASGTSRSQELASATAQLTELAPGDAAVCTFTNKPIPGTVTWEKVDAAGNHLGGSEWTLSGLDLSSTTVVDCTSATCDPGPYRDQDPAPGVFRIVGLAWGDYTLVESSAPAGFVRDDTPHNFTISAGARDYVFASAFVNIPREGPPLPLTGGQSATMYTLLGGGLLGLASVWAVLRRRRNIRGAA